jgi:hypothetical protein
MQKLLFAITLALLVNGPARAADGIIRNVNIVDVEAGTILKDRHILIESGRISDVTDTAPTETAGADFDARGGYLIPGLWDSHVHVFSSPEEPATAFPLYLLSGVTGIRDMGGLLPLGEMKEIAAAVEAGVMPGPRVVLSGAWVDASPGSWPGMFLADTAAEARDVVRRVAGEGWAAVKSYSMLREDVYLALAAQAEAIGLPLVGHIPETVSLPTAIGAGHDVVEHFGRVTKACSTEEAAMIAGVRGALQADDPRSAMIAKMTGHNQIVLDTWDDAVCDKVLASMARSGVHVVPTLVVADFYTETRPPDLDARMALLPHAVRQGWSAPDFRLEAMTPELRAIATQSIALDWRTLKLAHAAGVSILAGTDASFANPYIFHGASLLDELDRYVAGGLTPGQALFTATVAPSRLFAPADSGRIVPGMRADLVVLGGNPLDGLSVLRSPVAVVVNGRIFDAGDLDRLRRMLIEED